MKKKIHITSTHTQLTIKIKKTIRKKHKIKYYKIIYNKINAYHKNQNKKKNNVLPKKNKKLLEKNNPKTYEL